MSRSFIHKCVAYLLIALLPLQAVAAGRLALCAENPIDVSMVAAQMNAAVQQMDHCAQMVSMQAQDSESRKSTSNAPCWLGSICIVNFGAVTLSAPFGVSPAQPGAPIAFSTSAVYLSIISDTPQRPPAAL